MSKKDELKATEAILISERSTRGLREMLFQTLDDLRGGKIQPTQAQVTANIAKQILHSVQQELTAAKLLGNVKGLTPPNLRLVE